MRLFYGGAEVPSWRSFLADNGIKDVAMSYMGLRRKVQFKRPWLIETHFGEDQNVLLDGGAYTVNKDDSGLGPDELAEIASAYMLFVTQNIDKLYAVTEFDALALGQAWIKGVREDFWNDIGDKFMPVWHAEYGVDELESLASRYSRIAILQTELGDRDLTSLLNSLVARHGVKLHGLAMTKPERMREIRLDSVSSTSWFSPIQYGDTHVWNGKELKRFPKKYKVESRKRMRTTIRNAGFDPNLIMHEATDDSTPEDKKELLRLALWSWQKLVEDLNRRAAFTVGNHYEPSPPQEAEDAELGAEAVDKLPAETPNEQSAIAVPEPRPHQLLPGVSFVQSDDDKETGYGAASQSLRMCDSCFLADRGCPGFRPHAECVYEFPIKIRTPRQLDQVEDTAIEIQFQRVAFMHAVEDVSGGFIEPALSGEMDRLMRMLKQKRERDTSTFKLNISANQKAGELGMISNLFGREAGERMGEQIPETPVEDILRESEIAEAVVVDDGHNDKRDK